MFHCKTRQRIQGERERAEEISIEDKGRLRDLLAVSNDDVFLGLLRILL